MNIIYIYKILGELLPRLAGAAGARGQLRHRGLTLKRPGLAPFGGVHLPPSGPGLMQRFHTCHTILRFIDSSSPKCPTTLILLWLFASSDFFEVLQQLCMPHATWTACTGRSKWLKPPDTRTYALLARSQRELPPQPSKIIKNHEDKSADIYQEGRVLPHVCTHTYTYV